jgi:hypothetical protein
MLQIKDNFFLNLNFVNRTFTYLRVGGGGMWVGGRRQVDEPFSLLVYFMAEQ